MCNPPFYESSTDLVASAASKSRPPLSACTGAEVEMVTPGGEVAFVNAMVSESKILRDRCQWYTSMLGKYSSVEIITKNIRDAGIQNFAVKDLVQGNKTKRWAVAWSWGSMRPTEVCLDSIIAIPSGLCSSSFRVWREAIRQFQSISFLFLQNTSCHYLRNPSMPVLEI